jgi:hypothetical protein
MVQVKQLGEEKCKSVFTFSNSSAAPRESCNKQPKKNPFGSLNIEMIVKMFTWKIAENTPLANRLNKHVKQTHITSTWLFDTGADVTGMAMREFRKIPIEKRPIFLTKVKAKEQLAAELLAKNLQLEAAKKLLTEAYKHRSASLSSTDLEQFSDD